MNQKILDRIIKLRNLAANNSNPGEAANALAHMQHLLFQHNLSESDLSETSHPEPAYEKEYFSVGCATGFAKQWRCYLMNSIADNNFCRMFINSEKFVTIVGQPDNREIVKFMYDYISKDLILMSKVAKKIAKKNNLRFDNNLWTKSFFMGAISTITNRLKQQYRTSVNEADLNVVGSGTSLMVKTDRALEEAVKTLIGQVKVRRTRTISVNASGYESGRIAGNSVKLNDAIPSKKIALNG